MSKEEFEKLIPLAIQELEGELDHENSIRNYFTGATENINDDLGVVKDPSADPEFKSAILNSMRIQAKIAKLKELVELPAYVRIKSLTETDKRVLSQYFEDLYDEIDEYDKINYNMSGYFCNYFRQDHHNSKLFRCCYSMSPERRNEIAEIVTGNKPENSITVEKLYDILSDLKNNMTFVHGGKVYTFKDIYSEIERQYDAEFIKYQNGFKSANPLLHIHEYNNRGRLEDLRCGTAPYKYGGYRLTDLNSTAFKNQIKFDKILSGEAIKGLDHSELLVKVADDPKKVIELYRLLDEYKELNSKIQDTEPENYMSPEYSSIHRNIYNFLLSKGYINSKNMNIINLEGTSKILSEFEQPRKVLFNSYKKIFAFMKDNNPELKDGKIRFYSKIEEDKEKQNEYFDTLVSFFRKFTSEQNTQVAPFPKDGNYLVFSGNILNEEDVNRLEELCNQFKSMNAKFFVHNRKQELKKIMVEISKERDNLFSKLRDYMYDVYKGFRTVTNPQEIKHGFLDRACNMVIEQIDYYINYNPENCLNKYCKRELEKRQKNNEVRTQNKAIEERKKQIEKQIIDLVGEQVIDDIRTKRFKIKEMLQKIFDVAASKYQHDVANTVLSGAEKELNEYNTKNTKKR